MPTVRRLFLKDSSPEFLCKAAKGVDLFAVLRRFGPFVPLQSASEGSFVIPRVDEARESLIFVETKNPRSGLLA